MAPGSSQAAEPAPKETFGKGVQESWRTASYSRQLDGLGRGPVRVKVDYGGGRLTLGAASSAVLYDMELRYLEGGSLPVAEHVDDTLVRLGIETAGSGFNLGRSMQSGRLDLGLGREVPMHLDVSFGAGSADIDLGGLSLAGLVVESGASSTSIRVSEPNETEMEYARFSVGAAEFTAVELGNLGAERISVKAGVGQVTLDLGGEWRRDGTISVEMGLGHLTLMVPEGLGLRVDRDGILTVFDSEGLVKRGDTYYSTDWEDAPRRVRVELDASFGKVDVAWYSPAEPEEENK